MIFQMNINAHISPLHLSRISDIISDNDFVYVTISNHIFSLHFSTWVCLFFLPHKNELSFHSVKRKRIEKSDENKIENISKLTDMMSRKRTRFNQTVSMGILSQNGGSRAANTIIQKADIYKRGKV